MKIMIIGAGISGLAAADHLRNQSFDVTLLEARSHAGGRISVDHSWGFPIAKGAHWIHGTEGNPMMQLAERFNTPLSTFTKDRTSNFTSTGHLVPDELLMKWNFEFDEYLMKAKQFALSAKNDCSLALALSHFIPDNISNEFFKVYINRKLKFFENYIGANYENISARHWDISDSFSGEHCIAIDAFSSIIKGLSDPLDIRYNNIVSNVNLDNDSIEIITNQANYRCDCVIVTLPLGVLKNNSVLFNPALPPDKIKSIQQIGMGLFNIIALEFPESFWPEDHYFFL